MSFNLDVVDPSWRGIIESALSEIPPDFILQLNQTDYLPGPDHVFAAFSLPLDQTQYILFGESVYPRKESAVGIAFLDGAINDIWSDTGLSKTTNRATSMRNIIKCLLVTHGYLDASDTSQAAIAALDKSEFVQTLPELFANLKRHGFLMLNATLTFTDKQHVREDARAWLPFMEHLLSELTSQHRHIKLVLLGKIAEKIQNLRASQYFAAIFAEHPYNISFILNEEIQDFLRPFNLLQKQY